MRRERASGIVELRPHLRGVRVTLACGDCAVRFEAEQPGLGGIPVGAHPCPECGAELRVDPDQLGDALVRGCPDRSIATLTLLTEQASALAEGWHRDPELREHLRHGEVELGPPTERELMGWISLAVQRAHARRGPP